MNRKIATAGLTILGLMVSIPLDSSAASRTTVATSKQTRSTTTLPRRTTPARPMLQTFNWLVSKSDYGVVGRVMSVGVPRYNSPDGKPYKARRGEKLELYRDVALRVDKVIYGPAPSAEKLVLLGTGQSTGEVLFDLGGGVVIRENDYGGIVAVGDSIIAVVKSYPIFSATGITQVKGSLWGYQGIWRVRGDQAVSQDPQRSVPVNALIAKLQEEWAKGYDKDARGGDRNPFDTRPRENLPLPPPPTTPGKGSPVLPPPTGGPVYDYTETSKSVISDSSELEVYLGYSPNQVTLHARFKKEEFPDTGIGVLITNGRVDPRGATTDTALCRKSTSGSVRVMFAVTAQEVDPKLIPGLSWSKRIDDTVTFYVAYPFSDTFEAFGRTITCVNDWGPRTPLATTTVAK